MHHLAVCFLPNSVVSLNKTEQTGNLLENECQEPAPAGLIYFKKRKIKAQKSNRMRNVNPKRSGSRFTYTPFSR